MGTNMQDIQFLSTLSLRRATGCVAGNWPRGIFLSTLSLRRATLQKALSLIEAQQFLSTLSLRRATVGGYGKAHCNGISIHALLAESDGHYCRPRQSNKHFYPRSPCGERQRQAYTYISVVEFLSTLSLRRATPSITVSGMATLFLSTLSLRRATLWDLMGDLSYDNFYPRSPCGERLRILI